jgi:hypothetical protein
VAGPSDSLQHPESPPFRVTTRVTRRAVEAVAVRIPRSVGGHAGAGRAGLSYCLGVYVSTTVPLPISVTSARSRWVVAIPVSSASPHPAMNGNSNPLPPSAGFDRRYARLDKASPERR